MNPFEKAWIYVWNNLYNDKTGLIYDARSSFDDNGAIRHLPTSEEIANQIPNPCGWGTGMEDSMLNNGSMLEAIIARHTVTGENLGQEADKLLRGLILCATISDSPGFLARSVLPYDGQSHYINSSRDQYTHWVYSAWKYYRSPLGSNKQKEQIKQILLSFARKADREILPENGYCFLREDGKPAVVSQMWGDIEAHEYLRLPMIYAAAWDLSGEEHFLKRYYEYYEEALEKSLLVEDTYPYTYPLLQMQYSIRLLYDLFGDNNCLTLMNKTADCVMGFVPEVKISAFNASYTCWRKQPARYKYETQHGGYAYYVPCQNECYEQAYFPVRNAGESLIIQALCPERFIPDIQINLLCEIAEALDYAHHSTCAPVLLADAYWLLRSAGHIVTY